MEESKAQPIDVYLKNTLPGKPTKKIVEWPEKGDTSAKHQTEADLYGYGDATPTPRASARTPRRSSLKSGRFPRRASIGYTGEMTLTLPTGEKARRKTSISFADESMNTVTKVPPISELVDHPRRLWFQEEEYAHIQKKISSILTEVGKERKAPEPGKATLCTRGLESLMDRNVAHERKDAVSAVMEEQRMQKTNGNWDDHYIRDIYHFHSIESSVKAADRAERDNKDINSYMKLTKKYCRRMSC